MRHDNLQKLEVLPGQIFFQRQLRNREATLSLGECGACSSSLPYNKVGQRLQFGASKDARRSATRYRKRVCQLIGARFCEIRYRIPHDMREKDADVRETALRIVRETF